MYSGEYDACDVTLSVYPHRQSIRFPPWPGIFFKPAPVTHLCYNLLPSWEQCSTNTCWNNFTINLVQDINNLCVLSCLQNLQFKYLSNIDIEQCDIWISTIFSLSADLLNHFVCEVPNLPRCLAVIWSGNILSPQTTVKLGFH